MKNEETRDWVQKAVADGRIAHDSQGKLHVCDSESNRWYECDDYSGRNFIRLWTQEQGENNLTHRNIEFLRQEFVEEPILLAKELDYP